ncbi:MAG: RsmD family RNA methyltransferase, partial [Myxococcota bacterium]|nr:RsmD family RNA methyltransferase [Myxococcota bacterium]
GGRAEVRRGDAVATVARLAASGARYDLVLADPPYASREAARLLDAVARTGLLAPGGLLVLEVPRRDPPGPPRGLRLDDERRYGDTLVVRYVEGRPAPGDRPDAPGGPAGRHAGNGRTGTPGEHGGEGDA